MVSLDYMAHQEQYNPNKLIEFAQLAETSGFNFIWTSDHFHPWFHTNAEAGFAWTWLGRITAELETPIGTCVTPATGHYHPGIVAQSFATLATMHSERVVLGLSTGEAMNETPLGFPWPEYPERRDRLQESLEIVRALWGHDEFETDAKIEDGFVTYDGEYYELEKARLYTTPENGPEPQIHVAANGPSTAALAGRYCEGFITVLTGEEFTEQMYPAVRQHAEDAGRDPDAIETTLLVIASYDEDYEKAVSATEPWWATTQDVFDRAMANPKRIEQEGQKATREQIEEKFLIADDPAEIAAQLEIYEELGFDRIVLGNTSPQPRQFFEVMGEDVIPTL